MIFFMILMITLALSLCLYMFFAARRAVGLFYNGAKLRLSLISAGIIVLLAVLTVAFASMLVLILFVLHFAVFGLLTRLVNFILKKLSNGKKYPKWDFIYRLGAVPLVISLIFMVYGYFNMSQIVMTSYTIKSDKLSSETGCKIALLADIHYGTAGTKDDITSMVDDINKADIDAAVLCGDIIDENADIGIAKEVFKILGDIETKYGVYFIYGNHDYSAYLTEHDYSIEEFEAVLVNAGIKILKDEYVYLTDELILAGRLDRTSPRKNISSLLKGADREAFIIVADHQPTDFAAKKNAEVDLQISGHTHGGQIFPIGYINTLISPNESCYGMEKFGNMTSVVSSGVYGWGFPIRTQGKSEWVMIQISGYDE